MLVLLVGVRSRLDAREGRGFAAIMLKPAPTGCRRRRPPPMAKAKKSAGILLYRRNRGQLEVLLGHPGGPFWKNRDLGAWTIPKGEIDEGEDAYAAARREFTE